MLISNTSPKEQVLYIPTGFIGYETVICGLKRSLLLKGAEPYEAFQSVVDLQLSSKRNCSNHKKLLGTIAISAPAPSGAPAPSRAPAPLS